MTANRAPNALTSVRTNVIPKYPVIEKMNANPYAWTGFYKIKVKDNASVFEDEHSTSFDFFWHKFQVQIRNYHVAKYYYYACATHM